MSLWVVDTGPLVFLSKLNRLDLLRRCTDEVVIPSAVLQEVKVQPDQATKTIEEAAHSWLQVREVKNRVAVELLLADLDLGEAEVVVLAKELKAERVVLDDMEARRFTRRLGWPIIGTIGLLLAARLQGEIPSLREEIERLQQLGFWVSEPLVRKVLQEAGE